MKVSVVSIGMFSDKTCRFSGRKEKRHEMRFHNKNKNGVDHDTANVQGTLARLQNLSLRFQLHAFLCVYIPACFRYSFTAMKPLRAGLFVPARKTNRTQFYTQKQKSGD